MAVPAQSGEEGPFGHGRHPARGVIKHRELAGQRLIVGASLKGQDPLTDGRKHDFGGKHACVRRVNVQAAEPCGGHDNRVEGAVVKLSETGVQVAAKRLHFQVGPIPASWRSIDADYALLAYRNDASNSTIALNARCGVDGDDVPLSALTQHLFLEFTDRAQVSQKPVSLAGREALRSELVASLDGVKKRYLVYVLKKDGCVYDFMQIAAGGAELADQADFERFVQGFVTLD